MRTWIIGAMVTGMSLAGEGSALAQAPPPPHMLVDAGVMVERDPTESFYGSDTGSAGRGAVGVQLSDRSGLRFELDVPRWRVTDTTSTDLIYCAESANCVGGVGLVPARTTARVSVRTVSYSFLYARLLTVTKRLQVFLLGGGSLEGRAYQSSSSFDELGPGGGVLRHTAYETSRTKAWFAGVFGADAEVNLTSHLAVAPQFRFHTFPYPRVSILRPGIALRWRF
jgi:hypothetical protein